jgi:catechol-2,3-dioxygenase
MNASPRLKSFAPQLLVDDLPGAIKFYQDVLGFSFGPTWRGFYAIGARDDVEIHLKCAPKKIEVSRSSAGQRTSRYLRERHRRSCTP